MDDSFFGFDTSLPLDDDVSEEQIAEPPEEEYDALNDETFGSAINGDWEEVHENLVRLTGDLEGCVDALDGENRSTQPVIAEECSLGGKSENELQKVNQDILYNRSDLSNISTMKLDDLTCGGNAGDDLDIHNLLGNSSKLDVNIWSTHPIRKDGENMGLILGGMNKVDVENGMPVNPPYILRQNIVAHFQKQSQQVIHYHQNIENPLRAQKPSASKICTLEDIERNLILQQAVLKQQDKQQQKSQSSEMIEKVTKSKHSSENLSGNCKTSAIMLQQHFHQQQQRVQTVDLPCITNKELFDPLLQQKQPTHVQLKNVPRTVKVSQQSPIKVQHSTDNLTQQTQQNHQHQNLQMQQQQQQQQQFYSFSQMAQHTHCAPYRPPPCVTLVHPTLGARYSQFGHPPQLPPHPLLSQHSLLQRNLPNSHLPIALNNFAMHPNFNAIRAAATSTPVNNVTGVHPAVLLATQQQQQSNRTMGHLPIPLNPLNLLNHPAAPINTSSNVNGNMFNMRLMQEIQQNHPLLQNVQRPLHPTLINTPPVLVAAGKQLSHQANTLNMNHKKLNYTGRNDSLTSNANGNLPPEEYDEYSNLMSTRDKHWLIGIQLSQLNTDTPYIDDYYYTVYKERKGAQDDSVHSQAHKDNQLNHPLIQPKGHTQLILVQLGNKNGSRNGQLRERRNSDNYYGGANINSIVQDIKLPSYVFTPLKFENSLGKLQYGSVTAPRKIIDADIMTTDVDINAAKKKLDTHNSNKRTGGSDPNIEINNVHQTVDSTKDRSSSALSKLSLTVNLTATSNELTAVNGQRKSRYILLHIESLYRIILKLDDLNNPKAIATILTKKKKESERIAALELLEISNRTTEDKVVDVTSNACLKSKFNYDIETKEALIEKLIMGLQHDKIVAMMNVRKGKVLIKRILPYIEECDIRWAVWISVFSSLENVFKKDRDDAEGLLYALYIEFKKQIKFANFQTIVKISSAIVVDDKKANGLFCTKFGISSLVCLILQAEHIFLERNDDTLTYKNKENWRNFLDNIASALNRIIENQTICAAIEINSIQPMMDHFSRFKDLRLESLLTLLIEAKQQLC